MRAGYGPAVTCRIVSRQRSPRKRRDAAGPPASTPPSRCLRHPSRWPGRSRSVVSTSLAERLPRPRHEGSPRGRQRSVHGVVRQIVGPHTDRPRWHRMCQAIDAPNELPNSRPSMTGATLNPPRPRSPDGTQRVREARRGSSEGLAGSCGVASRAGASGRPWPTRARRACPKSAERTSPAVRRFPSIRQPLRLLGCGGPVLGHGGRARTRRRDASVHHRC